MQYKTVIIKSHNDTKELDKFLNDGWDLRHSSQCNNFVLFLLNKVK